MKSTEHTRVHLSTFVPFSSTAGTATLRRIDISWAPLDASTKDHLGSVTSSCECTLASMKPAIRTALRTTRSAKCYTTRLEMMSTVIDQGYPKIAVLYQAVEPPVINGVRKPAKPGGEWLFAPWCRPLLVP